MQDQRRQLLLERREFLLKTRQQLRREWRGVGWSILLYALVPVAGLVFGIPGILLALGSVTLLVCVAAYVVWNHRVENDTELEGIRDELRDLPEESTE